MRSGSSSPTRPPRSIRSPVPKSLSRLTEPRPASTRPWSRPTSPSPIVWALASAARVSNCCRVMRPRSPVGSERHSPSTWYSRCRARANASPSAPFSTRQPARRRRDRSCGHGRVRRSTSARHPRESTSAEKPLEVDLDEVVDRDVERVLDGVDHRLGGLRVGGVDALLVGRARDRHPEVARHRQQVDAVRVGIDPGDHEAVGPLAGRCIGAEHPAGARVVLDDRRPAVGSDHQEVLWLGR